MKITGTLNSFDFEFIKTMPILNTLDLRDIQNESLPASCLAETKISTVILPVVLKGSQVEHFICHPSLL